MALLKCTNEECPAHYREDGVIVEPHTWETEFTLTIAAYHGAPPAEFRRGECDVCGAAGEQQW